MDNDAYLEVAEKAARAAGGILLEMAGSVAIREKAPADLVTSADVASQHAIHKLILDAFDDHAFLAEESPDPSALQAPFCWIVDPLDGTTNYVHQFGLFAVSIALKHHEELLVGVIYDPSRDECFCAAKGQGATLNGNPIQTSNVARLKEALLVTGFPPDLTNRLELLELFGTLTCTCHGVRRLGSAALDLAYVACGQLDGFYSTHLKRWDAAAGVLIVAEAGGRLGNLDGSAYDLNSPDIVATNERIFDELISRTSSYA